VARPYYKELGLDAPPEDRRAVKRAYSKRLKETRPEDDPEGFMRLRDAHDMALHILAHQPQPELSYETLIEDAAEPEPEVETQEDTSYSIGGPRGFDPAPELEPEPQLEAEEPEDTRYSVGGPRGFAAPAEPQKPPLYEELKALINSADRRNDRESWNGLFRKAKLLDIDDYVDFEDMVLDAMLQVQGFYKYDHPDHNMPEKMHRVFDPLITASMFRTLNWDQVSKHNPFKAQRIQWLERRMQFRPAREAAVEHTQPDPEAPGGMSFIWGFLLVIFFIAQFARFLANA
jgi:hypothetical protein